jgi:hypothetical protein
MTLIITVTLIIAVTLIIMLTAYTTYTRCDQKQMRREKYLENGAG